MSEIRIDASSLVDEIRVYASSVDELDIVVDGITTLVGNYLTKVEHDDTLVGSGIAGDELGVNTADSTIDGLKDETSGGEVPDEDYNWFKSVYTSLVDGSVKSWIKGLVNQLKDLAARVLNLENVQTIVYTVPSDCASITITQFPDGRPLNIQEGETVEIITRIMAFVGGVNDRLALQVNGVSSAIYRVGGFGLLPGVILAGSNYTSGIYQPRFTFINGEIVGVTHSYTNSNGSWSSTAQMYPFITEGLSTTQITSITIYSYNNIVVIPANEKIIIKIHRK